MKFKLIMLAVLAVASFQNICAMEHKNPYGRKSGKKTSQRNPRRNPRVIDFRGPSTRDQARRQEERDLKRAIQLSLQDQGHEVEVNDPQLKKALEGSRQEAQNREDFEVATALSLEEHDKFDRVLEFSAEEAKERRAMINSRFSAIVCSEERWTEKQVQEIFELIDAGANANDPYFLSHLVRAILEDSLDVCETILAAGIAIDAKNIALQLAVKAGRVEICRLLIASGAQVITELLHDAISKGHSAICQLLMDNGADIHARVHNRGRCTALREAARYGHPQLCSLLLDNGADIEGGNGCYCNHRTPLEEVSSVIFWELDSIAN